MKKFLPILILLSALAVSGSAAFYSVYGLGKLFAGASLQVMIMAATLEGAKLVVATALHRYWSIMNKLMKFYLTLSVIVLIGITSAGIYGFLSSAYQITASKDAVVTKKVEILELKKERFDQQRTEYRNERDQIIANITDLRKSISSPNQVQYVDRKSGQLVTTTSAASRKSLEIQLDDAINRRDQISQKIEIVTDSLTQLDVAIVEAEANSDTSSELGPLKYLSGLTGKPMDVVVNWFLMLLIFVFDPLAVTLVVLANFAFSKVYGNYTPDSENNYTPPTSTLNYTSPAPTVDHAMWSHEYHKNIEPLQNDIDTNDSSNFISVVDEHIPDIEVDNPRDVVQPTRKILHTDINDTVTNHIDGVISTAHDTSQNTAATNIELNDRQKANMTHQEIMDWYKKTMRPNG